jgi:hypothetical protein
MPAIPSTVLNSLSEGFVVASVRKALKRRGYLLGAPRSLRTRGVDISARHPRFRHHIFVECKGYPTGYSEAAQRDNYFLAILGQILLRMRQKNAYYAVALPDHPFYRKRILAQGLRLARRWLGLWFFLVKPNGTILHLDAVRSAFKEFR